MLFKCWIIQTAEAFPDTRSLGASSHGGCCCSWICSALAPCLQSTGGCICFFSRESLENLKHCWKPLCDSYQLTSRYYHEFENLTSRKFTLKKHRQWAKSICSLLYFAILLSCAKTHNSKKKRRKKKKNLILTDGFSSRTMSSLLPLPC